MSDNELSRRLERLGKVLLDEPRLERALSRAERKLERGEQRAMKRELRRGQQVDGNSIVRGGVMMIAAIICAVVGVVDPHRFWMIFVALGLALGGGKQIEGALRARKRLEASIPRSHDLAEDLCDRLLKELKDSPAAVRDFLGKPEATVEAIRSACRQLAERRQLMLDAVSPVRAAELADERKQLEQRLGHLDPATYKRATDALRQRQELFDQVRASAEKLESERQILLNTLESLRMRVVLAKGAGGQGDALGEMKREVDRLSEELSAITDALETVQKSEQQAIAPIESADPALAATAAPRERS